MVVRAAAHGGDCLDERQQLGDVVTGCAGEEAWMPEPKPSSRATSNPLLARIVRLGS